MSTNLLTAQERALRDLHADTESHASVFELRKIEDEPVAAIRIGGDIQTRYERPCPHCDRTYMTQDGYDRHVADRHSSPKRHGENNG